MNDIYGLILPNTGNSPSETHSSHTLGLATPANNWPEIPSKTLTTEQPTGSIDAEVKQLVALKQGEYAKKARLFNIIHYTSLTLGAGLGIITPFIIPKLPDLAQLTSIAVVALISFDQIYKPKEKWALYSKATDLMQLQIFKKMGVYDKNKDLIDTILSTESQILSTIPGLNEVLKQVNTNQKN